MLNKPFLDQKNLKLTKIAQLDIKSSNKICMLIFLDSLSKIKEINLLLREWLESKLKIIFMKEFIVIIHTLKV